MLTFKAETNALGKEILWVIVPYEYKNSVLFTYGRIPFSLKMLLR